jgi:hypothetical protein
MSEKPTSQPNSLDDKLAEFADQVLGGQVPPAAGLDDEDEEMRLLAHMVMRLNEEFSADQPSSEMAERIKARLVTEWHKSDLGKQEMTSRTQWWQGIAQGRASSYRQQQVFTFALVAITVIVLVVVMVSPLSTDGTLTGTAGIEGSILLPVLLLGAVLLGVLVWFLRRRS